MMNLLSESQRFCLKWHLLNRLGSRRFGQFALMGKPFNLLALLNALTHPPKRLAQRWDELDAPLTSLLRQAKRFNIIPICYCDEAYPERLKHIDSPPPVLWCLGNDQVINQPFIAIVGSRKPSPIARKNTLEITEKLTQAQLGICSGLAMGIDAIAHQGALNQNGLTVAVLGTGVDIIYPKKNRSLANAIIANGGCLISELPLGTPPRRTNFPARNRIISGMSLGTLITEASLNSGSLITARFAMEQNREVFALPASIQSPQGAGSNWLIQQGAQLVTQANDVLQALAFAPQPSPSLPPVITDPLLELMGFEIWHFEELLSISQLDIRTLKAHLLRLEISRHVEKMSGARWQRVI